MLIGSMAHESYEKYATEENLRKLGAYLDEHPLGDKESFRRGEAIVRYRLKHPEFSLRQVGEHFGVTPERVRQQEARTLQRLRRRDWEGN